MFQGTCSIVHFDCDAQAGDMEPMLQPQILVKYVNHNRTDLACCKIPYNSSIVSEDEVPTDHGSAASCTSRSMPSGKARIEKDLSERRVDTQSGGSRQPTYDHDFSPSRSYDAPLHPRQYHERPYQHSPASNSHYPIPRISPRTHNS